MRSISINTVAVLCNKGVYTQYILCALYIVPYNNYVRNNYYMHVLGHMDWFVSMCCGIWVLLGLIDTLPCVDDEQVVSACSSST